jgi:hypothetical protein
MRVPFADQFHHGLDLRFQFIFPIPPQTEAIQTPLFAFTLDVIDLIKALGAVLRLPAHPHEISAKRETVIAQRMSGATYFMLPIPLIALESLTLDFRSPLVCFVTSRVTHATISAYRKTLPHPTLQLSTEPSPGTVLLSKVRIGHLCKHVEAVRKFFSAAGDSETLSALNRVKLRQRTWRATPLLLTKFNHLSVLPNQLVLESFHFQFKGEGVFPPESNEPYIRAIAQSAQAMIDAREKVWRSGLPSPPATTLILTVPTFLKHLYGKIRVPKDDLHNTIKFFNALVRQREYRLTAYAQDIAALIKDPAARATIAACQQEIRAYSLCVAAKAANSFAPVLRLPPSLNQFHTLTARIAGSARGNSPHARFKQNKLLRELKSHLSANVPAQFLTQIDSGPHPIKLICDVPLEWLPIRGLPLMLRAEVSRIPTTPGNLLFEQCVSVGAIVLTPAFLQSILIIRSFASEDPVAPLLPLALQDAVIKNLHIQTADVTSPDDIVRELQQFQGGIVIFDCHGSPARPGRPGQLLIDGKGLDIWSLRGKFPLPPIVFLSSCDTHSIDGTSDSVANSFLLLGAKTVIASALPLAAKDASVLLARLLYRLSEYVPIVTSQLDRSVRWVSIMTGLQRMVYLTELLELLCEQKFVSMTPAERISLLTVANMPISAGKATWFEDAVALFSKAAACSPARLLTFVEQEFNAPESTKYIQLGNPEDILIASRGLASHLESSSQL